MNHFRLQKYFIVVAELTSVGVAAVFDEVGADVHFQQFFHHLPNGGVVVPFSQLGELRSGLSLQDPIHVGLEYRLHVLRMQVHEQVDSGALGDIDEIKVQAGQIRKLRHHLDQHWEKVWKFAFLCSDQHGADTESALGPQQFCHAVLISGHACSQRRIAVVDSD
jgi:hypothetical protein